MPNQANQNDLQPLPPAMNIHQISSFIPVFDGSFPIQDFLQEVRDAKQLGAWTDTVTLKVAKSKLQGRVSDIVRNRNDLNHAPTFEDFASRLTAALHTDRPVASRLQDLMTCTQHPSESVDAFASRVRNLAKSLTEWDATAETQQLKNRTASAAFVKGLKPSIRQLVIPQNPADFDSAISLARTHELNSSFMPATDPVTLPSASATQAVDPVNELQRRVASLELASAKPVNTSYRGRGRGPYRTFRQQNSPRGRGFSTPPTYYNRPRYDSTPRYPHRAFSSDRCHCLCSERRGRSPSRPDRDYYRRSSRSGSRDRRERPWSRSPSRSPDRYHSDRFRRVQSPNAPRSRR